MQHALLETPAHYVDFPWRPVNCVQKTGMPDTIPAANAFYDVTNETRRELHRTYIRKCLDELGNQTNVVHLVGEEYTGPLPFMEFWIDTLIAWQQETGQRLHIGLVGTKDVVDAILADPERGRYVSVICLSYWWYKAEGALYAPTGGQEVPGRYTGQLPNQTSPESLYRQVREYRDRYPDKALIQHHPIEVEKTWAFLMGGGSMIVAPMQYADSAPPKQPWEPPEEYVAPPEAQIIQPTYDFIRTHLAVALPYMKPVNIVQDNEDHTWCLAEKGKEYLVFALRGGALPIDLVAAPGQKFRAQWFDPRSGALSPAGLVTGGSTVSFTCPNDHCWALWLSATNGS
jgi:hypothetical protein